ncbi:MAG: hypothetical protein VB081_12555 [Christensenella sp.]|uniref:hypothetical protein n=1 Tax=Christensenella sp. TaxID=1935934 RepID=UPI002B207492|nr:hypothetical protein [Christensenella sp.]MEA5004310.1 hypothetical protein [Christensenella sp.]
MKKFKIDYAIDDNTSEVTEACFTVYADNKQSAIDQANEILHNCYYTDDYKANPNWILPYQLIMVEMKETIEAAQ